MPRIYPELLAEGLAAARGDRGLGAGGCRRGPLLDVTEVAETKMAAIWCHTSQNGEANGDRDWLFEHRVAPWMTEAGQRIGCRYAERFRRIPIRRP